MIAPDSESLAPLPTPTGLFDPRAKLFVYLLTFSVVLLATELTDLLLLNAAALLAVLVMRASETWHRALWLLSPTLVLFAVIVGLSDGPITAASAVLRLLGLVTVSVLFFTTTPPTELGESLLASGVPPTAVFLLEGTLRFTPMMALLVSEVREAQESRGIRLDGVYLLRNGTALLAPLLADVMRFADDLAEALEARGFGGPTRTPLADYRFRLRDWALVFGISALAVAAAALRHVS